MARGQSKRRLAIFKLFKREKGATLDGAVLTGYTSQTPVTYVYDCGMPSPTFSEMGVILHITGDDEEDSSNSGGGNGSSSGGIVVPPQTGQKPVIATDSHCTATLSSDGTKVTIQVETGYEVSNVMLNGESLGKVTTISGLKTGDRVSVTTEKITSDQEIIQKIKQQLEQVTWQNLKARSAQVKMKSGKKAIKITWKNTSGVDFDGVEVFRSTKRYSDFGTKPIFTTTNEQYYNTAIKKGTKYYYKVRGYIEYDGVKYYSDWSAKAWRTVK